MILNINTLHSQIKEQKMLLLRKTIYKLYYLFLYSELMQNDWVLCFIFVIYVCVITAHFAFLTLPTAHTGRLRMKQGVVCLVYPGILMAIHTSPSPLILYERSKNKPYLMSYSPQSIFLWTTIMSDGYRRYSIFGSEFHSLFGAAFRLKWDTGEF